MESAATCLLRYLGTRRPAKSNFFRDAVGVDRASSLEVLISTVVRELELLIELAY